MPTISISQVKEVNARARCIYSKEQVEVALDVMAAEITRFLVERDPILLCTMHGGLITTAKLVTRLRFPLQLDYLHVTRYRESTYGTDLHWKCYPSLSLQDRVVLVVDDILDEGTTLESIVEYCKKQEAAEVFTAVLLRSCMITSFQTSWQLLLVSKWMTATSMGMEWTTKGIFVTHLVFSR